MTADLPIGHVKFVTLVLISLEAEVIKLLHKKCYLEEFGAVQRSEAEAVNSAQSLLGQRDKQVKGIKVKCFSSFSAFVSDCIFPKELIPFTLFLLCFDGPTAVLNVAVRNKFLISIKATGLSCILEM